MVEATARRHTLEGVLRRLAALPEAGLLVLRGGMVMRLYAGETARPVEDVDFLGLFPFDAGRAETLIQAICERSVEDSLELRFGSSEVIWAETAFPGVRGAVHGMGPEDEFDLQIDIGFGDPVVPDPEWIDYPTLQRDPPARLLACRPETLLGWKLHGLYERGPGRWRPKDLFDVHLLLAGAPLDMGAARAAVRTAFESRGDSPALMEKLLAGRFGKSPWSAHKWASFRKSRPEGSVPKDLGALVTMVAAALGPIVASIG